MNKVEQWKADKHGFDVWPDVLRYAAEHTPMKAIDGADLERMKWHGVFYRKRDGDGAYMLRIRLTGCELSAAQAKEIAYIAYEYGHGIADVTTRANIQVQGLSIDHVPKAITRLEAVGLTAKQTGHDNIRNVFGHPLAGVDPEELIDTRGLCAAITQLFAGSRTYSDLPRKFNIAVNGRPRHGTHYWTQDISFLACQTGQREVMFQVLVGGNQGQNPHLARHLPVLVEPGQVVAVTRALLDLFREQGLREKRDESRFCYLLERVGVGGVLGYLEEHLDFPLHPSVAEPPPPDGYDELVGWLPQKPQQDETSLRQAGSRPQRWAMGLCLPLGRLAWQQLERLALLSRKWGDGTLRTTHEQGIVVLNIPTGFRDAAATDAAACGLSVHADTLVRGAVACTGKQFCNIAVTETKGQMFRLLEKLRQRGLALHNIRIHMSGCPSACAAHHTADIGLKGVRVRRLLGTREGFDVYLGGGVAGQVHLGRPFRLGVDADQLPQLVEDVIREYYFKHMPGQTFSAYWREQLTRRDAATVGEEEYAPPVWLCEGCGYRHAAEDPPVFCPSCAGLRRLFARVEQEDGMLGGDSAGDGTAISSISPPLPTRDDGFLYVAPEAEIPSGRGLAVQVAGQDLALFRKDGQIMAIDNACPHQGGPLADGELVGGVLTCPWHGWTFDPCTGCSLRPAGHPLRAHAVKIESGQVYVHPQAPEDDARSGPAATAALAGDGPRGPERRQA